MLVFCLKGLAGVVVAAGTILGLVHFAAGARDVDAATLLTGGASLLGGWVAGALLWASAWIVGHVHRVAERLEEEAPRVARTGAVPAIEREAARPLRIQPETEERWRDLTRRLEEINANLLLTGPEREAKHRQAQLSLADRLVDEAGRAVSDGDFDEAERLLAELTEKFPEEDRADELRERIISGLAEKAEQAAAAGEVAAAEQLIERLGRIAPDDPRAEALSVKLGQMRSSAEVDEIRRGKAEAEALLAVADYSRAQALAEQLAERHPDSQEAKAFAALVCRDATAFRDEQRARMYNEIERLAETRQWRLALVTARKLLKAHRGSKEAEDVTAMMLTIEENARIEEVRELRDSIRELIERRRFDEAVKIAEEIIHRFPDTQAAGELSRQIERLRHRAGIPAEE